MKEDEAGATQESGGRGVGGGMACAPSHALPDETRGKSFFSSRAAESVPSFPRHWRHPCPDVHCVAEVSPCPLQGVCADTQGRRFATFASPPVLPPPASDLGPLCFDLPLCKTGVLPASPSDGVD